MRSAVADYLNAQIDAGAQAVMIFDTWGGVLADGAFQELLPGLHAARSCRQLTARARRRARALHRLHQGWRSVARADRRHRLRRGRTGLDRRTWARRARRIGDRCALQGNLDPMVLFAPPTRCARRRSASLDAFGPPRACRWSAGRAMSSTSGTASSSSRRRSRSQRWSTRCINHSRDPS